MSCSKRLLILRGIAFIMVLMLNCGAAFAQTPPTATEAFNLRIRCKEMADKKADGFYLGPPEEIIFSAWTSRYDPKTNRCYIGLYTHKVIKKSAFDLETRQVYEATTDELLAFANLKNGTKSGMVFDHDNHKTTTNDNLGWDDAINYMDELMADKRN